MNSSAHGKAQVQAKSSAFYRPEIDGLRAIAVLSVVLFHAGISVLGGGFVGVDVFFVISGFLITGVIIREIDEDRFTFSRFYERRIRRIIPALFVVVVLTLAALYAISTTDLLVSTGGSAIAAVLSVSNIYFYGNTGYFDLASAYQPLLHTWSLGVEEQFYIGFPIYLILLRRWTRLSWPVALLALIIPSFAANIYLTGANPKAAFYLPVGRLWELALGGLIATWNPASYRRMDHRLAEAASATGLVILIGSILLTVESPAFPGWLALPPCLGTALIIAGNCGRLTLSGRLLANRLFVGVGLISYSLYLWHWPVLVIARLLSDRPFGPGLIAALLVGILLLSVLSWRFVEQPIRRSSASRGTLFAGTGVLSAAIMGIGAIFVLSGGLPGRLSAAQRGVDAAVSDTNPTRSECDKPNPEQLAQGYPCVLGVRDVPQVALFGDSYADALSPGVVHAAELGGQGIGIYTRSGCRPLIGISTRPACEAGTLAAIEAIRRDPAIKAVVFVARWPEMTEGSRFGAGPQELNWLDQDPAKVANKAENLQFFERALANTIAAFGTKKVYLVTGIPEQQAMVPYAILSRARLGLPAPQGVSRDVFLERYAASDAVLAQLKADGVAEVIDLRQQMCAGSDCLIQQDGIIRYVDDNHPSSTYARSLAPLFQPVFVGPGSR